MRIQNNYYKSIGTGGGISDMCLGFLLASDKHFDETDDTSFTFMHLPSNSGGKKFDLWLLQMETILAIRRMGISISFPVWCFTVTFTKKTATLDRFFMFENKCIKYSDFFIHPFRTNCWSQLGVSHGSDNLIVATAKD